MPSTPAVREKKSRLLRWRRVYPHRGTAQSTYRGKQRSSERGITDRPGTGGGSEWSRIILVTLPGLRGKVREGGVREFRYRAGMGDRVVI